MNPAVRIVLTKLAIRHLGTVYVRQAIMASVVETLVALGV